MAQSAPTFDRKVFQGTAAATGGTFVANFAPATDQIAYLRAIVLVSRASAAHQADGACLSAEYVVENKNGTLTALAGVTSSNSPSNSNTAAYAPAKAMGTDYSASGQVTLTWTVSTPNAVCTYTNVGNPSIVNVTIIIESVTCGST